MKAILKNYRQAPRKVRLVTDLIKRKSVPRALAELRNLPKRASLPIIKLLRSAVANAKVQGASKEESLLISKAVVNAGVVLKRRMPRARGSAFPILKRTSTVTIELIETK